MAQPKVVYVEKSCDCTPHYGSTYTEQDVQQARQEGVREGMEVAWALVLGLVLIYVGIRRERKG